MSWFRTNLNKSRTDNYDILINLWKNKAMDSDTISSFYEDTLFIVVIYNCEISQSVTFQSLNKSKPTRPKDIFIYDNSQNSQTIPQTGETIYYYHNTRNGGVSAAYNQGFEKAKELNKKWLLLLDQDTHFDAEVLEKYAQSIMHYPDVHVFAPLVKSDHGLVSPFRLMGGKGIRFRSRQPGIHFFRPVYVINSGLLVETTLFEAAGGYDELFPLDFSDVVFIKRLSTVDKRFVLIDTTSTHSLSSEDDWHATTNNVLDRFGKFCLAAKRYKKTSNELVMESIVIFPRAIKLTLMKKDLRFLFLAMRSFFNSK